MGRRQEEAAPGKSLSANARGPMGRGDEIGHLRHSLEDIAKASGIKFMVHELRRTFATLAETLDIPSYALKRLMNHKARGRDGRESAHHHRAATGT